MVTKGEVIALGGSLALIGGIAYIFLPRPYSLSQFEADCVGSLHLSKSQMQEYFKQTSSQLIFLKNTGCFHLPIYSVKEGDTLYVRVNSQAPRFQIYQYSSSYTGSLTISSSTVSQVEPGLWKTEVVRGAIHGVGIYLYPPADSFSIPYTGVALNVRP